MRPEEFNDWLHRHGLTREEAAHRLGVCPMTISRKATRVGTSHWEDLGLEELERRLDGEDTEIFSPRLRLAHRIAETRARADTCNKIGHELGGDARHLFMMVRDMCESEMQFLLRDLDNLILEGAEE